jgi:hypothetical protein
MQGDGLHRVSFRVTSDRPAVAQVQWILWNGMPDHPDMKRAFEGVLSLELQARPQWASVDFVRNGTSHNRWYTLETKLVDARATAPGPPPLIAVMASRDNPDLGGVLWVNGARQPGSLFLRADQRGRTRYRQFVNDAEPHLPALLRQPVIQWSVVVAIHAALLTFVAAVFAEAAASRPPS